MIKPLILEFLKDPNIASIKPSSRYVVEDICKIIDFSSDIIVVEYGPGNGVITKSILGRMSENSRLIVVETNNRLAKNLKGIEDSRLIVVLDSAHNITNILQRYNIGSVNYVVSGIPFSMIESSMKRKIVEDTRKILSDRGYFIVYQFRKGVLRHLSRSFSSIKAKFELRNIPPLFIFYAKK